MSFFTNMFGGGKKKPDPKLQKEIQNEKNQLQRLQAGENLEKQVQKWEVRIKAKNDEISKLEQEVKNMIKMGKKDRAKMLLKKIKSKRQNVVKLNKQVNLLYKQMNQLESTEQDQELYGIIKDTNKVQQQNQENMENLQEELEKARELEQERKMNDDMLNDLLEDEDEDEDELDDMLKGYEEEVALDMEQGFNQAEQNAQLQPQQQQQQAQPQANKNADGFDNLMAEIMG